MNSKVPVKEKLGQVLQIYVWCFAINVTCEKGPKTCSYTTFIRKMKKKVKRALQLRNLN